MSYSVAPFSADQLYTDLASNPCIPEDAGANPRARYLFEYFKHLGATTIISELEYVDADYLDDYASFYAKSFEPIPN
jgi:hypothetical protein